MPNMANIVVKKADGTTDITYTAATPSAGDQTPAVWRQNSPTTIGFRPKFTVRLRDNAAGNARNYDGALEFPITRTDTASGIESLAAKTFIRFSGTLPTNVPVSAVTEAIHQGGNLFVSALIRSALTEGYAPT